MTDPRILIASYFLIPNSHDRRFLSPRPPCAATGNRPYCGCERWPPVPSIMRIWYNSSLRTCQRAFSVNYRKTKGRKCSFCLKTPHPPLLRHLPHPAFALRQKIDFDLIEALILGTVHGVGKHRLAPRDIGSKHGGESVEQIRGPVNAVDASGDRAPADNR